MKPNITIAITAAKNSSKLVTVKIFPTNNPSITLLKPELWEMIINPIAKATAETTPIVASPLISFFKERYLTNNEAATTNGTAI